MIMSWVKGYSGLYEISPYGAIYSQTRGQYKRPTMTPSGLVVGLSKNGVQSRRYVHRLVYEAYKGDIKGMIHFKDGDKSNCRIDNLVDVVGKYNFSNKKI